MSLIFYWNKIIFYINILIKLDQTMDDNEKKSSSVFEKDVTTQQNFKPIEQQLKINGDEENSIKIKIVYISILVVSLLVFFLIFALPEPYQTKTNASAFRESQNQCNNPYDFSNQGVLYCQNFSINSPIVGLLTRNITILNQFVIVFLDFFINPQKSSSFKIDQEVILRVHEVIPTETSVNGTEYLHFYQSHEVYHDKFTYKSEEQVKVPEEEEKYHQGRRVEHQGVQKRGFLGLIRDVKANHNEKLPNNFFISLQLTDPEQLNNVNSIHLVALTLDPIFTRFSIIITAVFFVISVACAVLYLKRYFSIPQEKRIIELKLVAIGSVLIIMFNDPLYIVTILSPNAASIVFTSLFIINFLEFILILWVIMLKRIIYEHEDNETKLLGFKNNWAFYVLILISYSVSLAFFIDYSFFTIQQMPVVNEYQLGIRVTGLLIATIIFFVINCLSILYYFIKAFYKYHGNKKEFRPRHKKFLFISPFIFVILIICVSAGGTMIYSHEIEFIFYAYSFLNIYLWILQFLYYPSIEKSNENQEIIFKEIS